MMMRWTIVPAALLLIAAANIAGGVDPFSYGVAFTLVFVWLGLSQPRWTSMRFAVPATIAYIVPLVVHDRPAGDLATAVFVLPVCIGLGEGCGWIAQRLKAAQADLRTINAGIERLLRATADLARAKTEREAGDLVAELARELLAADRVLVMVAETVGADRFVARGRQNVSVDEALLVIDVIARTSAVQRAASTGEVLFIDNVQACGVVPPRLAEVLGAASALFIPLLGEGGSFGTIVATWDAPRLPLDSFSQRAVAVLSEETGRALEQTRSTARLARDLDERTVATEALRAEQLILGLLGAATTAANEAPSPAAAYQRIVDEICSRTGWPIGHVYRLDETESLRSTGVWHLDNGEQFDAFRVATEETPVAPGIHIASRVAESRETIWAKFGDGELDHPRGPIGARLGLEGTLAFPVLLDGRTAAVVEFFVAEPEPPHDDMLAVMSHLAAQLGRVLERQQAKEALQTSEERFRKIVETAGDPYICIDAGGYVQEWNRQAEVAFGWSRDEAVGCAVADLIIPEALRPLHRMGLRRFIETGEATIIGRPVELSAVTRDGGELPVEITVWATQLGEAWRFNAFVRDISERARFEAELTRQALHDALTGLPNRTLFLDRLDHALARSTRAGSDVTVLFLDLDGFKTINDSLGHATGDRLLVAVGRRLQKALRPEDTVARLGGDEFAVLLEETDTGGGIVVAERLAATLAAPVPIGSRQVFIQASVGIATRRADEGGEEELLRNADLAMYLAKRRRKGGYAVYEVEMHQAAIERLELEADLRRALGSKEFFLHYQPIFRLDDLSLVGTEALLRWRRGGDNLVSPQTFVPVAEETGFIIEIGRWVLREACRQVRAWDQDEAGAMPLSLSVNLSARQIQSPEIVADVNDALDGSGLDPSRLTLEITESSIMQDSRRAAMALAELRELGVRLAVDDFGTGYSSLSYLRRFPIDVLKIDRSFVSSLSTGPEDAALAHAIVKLGMTLKLGVVAEGIETDDQLDQLRSFGCEYGQGYLLARPLAPEDLVSLRNQAWHQLRR